MKGKLITLEGIEGAGKSTQARMLHKYLHEKNYSVTLTREPGGTILSNKIREILIATANEGMCPLTECLLFSAARAQHIEEFIKPNLRQGKIVICDRFFDATTAYQGYGRGLDLKIIDDINFITTSGLKPDLTIFLDLSPEEATKRLQNRLVELEQIADRIEREKKAFFIKVREGYHEIAKQEVGRFKILRADSDRDKLFEEILLITKQALSKWKISPYI